MNRSRLAAFCAAGIAVLTSTLAAGPLTAQAQSPAPAGAPVSASPLRITTPPEVHAWSHRGRASFDPGVRIIAQNEPFEIWSQRPSYDDLIQTEWRSGNGSVAFPEGIQTDFRGLPNFMRVDVWDEGGNLLGRTSYEVCLNGWQSERTSPDAPIRSPYPSGCPYNKFTLGSVQGIQEGWGTRLDLYSRGIKLGFGSYTATATIPKIWREPLGISKADATAEFTLVVDDDVVGCRGCRTHPRPADVSLQPGEEPTSSRAGAPGGTMPDLRSLPAFGIQVTRGGNYLAFAANVWNGGDSPLVIDGFRDPGEDVMDAYQYFIDENGEQTGYEQVGTMIWHDAASHHHWHFLDFARYSLLNEDMTEAVRSKKESFCLANTDAVDLTVPGAEWRPENTDLHTSCGYEDTLSLREVLSAGHGDTYSQYRAGQSFSLKGLPNGVYYVAVQANPDGNLVEHNYDNNTSYRKVIIGGSDGARTVRVTQVGIIK